MNVVDELKHHAHMHGGKHPSEYEEKEEEMKFSRQWAMPNHNTFSIRPIGDFVKLYLNHSAESADPFARDKCWATHTNDLNPETAAQHHMQAVDFMKLLSKGMDEQAAIIKKGDNFPMGNRGND